MPRLNQHTAWTIFVDWCQNRGLRPLPANPWTVAAYARWCETNHHYQAIVNMVKAIAKEHMRKSRKRPDRHPLVTRTLNLIAKREEEREDDKVQAAALFPEEDFVSAEAAESTAQRVQREVQTRTQGAAQGLRRALRATPKLVSRRPSLT
jgi:predicted membrane chloride channel (bestrophin family)